MRNVISLTRARSYASDPRTTNSKQSLAKTTIHLGKPVVSVGDASTSTTSRRSAFPGFGNRLFLLHQRLPPISPWRYGSIPMSRPYPQPQLPCVACSTCSLRNRLNPPYLRWLRLVNPRMESNRVIYSNHWYNLGRLEKLYNIPVRPCPERCGGVRFQWHPNAACRGRHTCWMSRAVSGTVLISRCKYLIGCLTCDNYFRSESKHDVFCRQLCEGVPCQKCATCLEPLSARDIAHKQVVSGQRVRFRRGPADTFPFTTFTVSMHKRCLASGTPSVKNKV